MQFSVVVPVYNEAGNIRPLLAELGQALHGEQDYEIVYVDDGSEDSTRTELESMCEQFPRLRLLRHPSRCGQSSALLSGVRAARGAWIVTLDGDGQNDPADIPLLLSRMRSCNDAGKLMLAGHRVARQDSWIKCCSSRVANAVRRWILHDETPDTGCGLKLFPRQLFLSLPAFDHMHRFLPALVKREGARVESVPVGHRSRCSGVSKYGVHNRLWVGLVDVCGVMWLQRRRIGVEKGKDRGLSRFGDHFGVRWLQQRSCHAIFEEEG